MPYVLKLMPSNEAWPLWSIEGTNCENLNPNSLPLSTEIKTRLEEWNNQFRSLNLLRGPTPDPDLEIKLSEFEEGGQVIWKLLQQELSPDHLVVYDNHKQYTESKTSDLHQSNGWKTTFSVSISTFIATPILAFLYFVSRHQNTEGAGAMFDGFIIFPILLVSAIIILISGLLAFFSYFEVSAQNKRSRH